MLGLYDILTIIGTAAGCTLVVTILAMILLRVKRNGSIGFRFGVIVAASLSSVIFTIMAISIQMYISEHDLVVLIWVVFTSAALSLLAAWLIGRTASSSVARLHESAQRIGAGGIVSPQNHQWKEFAELSTRLAATSEKLAAAREVIEQNDASRRELFAWISHDLRSPLTGMRAIVEAFEEGLISEHAPYMRTLGTKIDTASRMVDDLFELSKVHSVSLRLRKEPVVLLDLVSDAVADVRGITAARNIVVNQRGVDGLHFWAAPHELTRVIANLLTNSARYAPENSEILVCAEQRDPDWITLQVIDAGPGVPDEQLERMFEIGWRANVPRTPSSTEGEHSGAGLGLAIVRGVVESHGGLVQARKVAGGFMIEMTLPTREPLIENPTPESEAHPKAVVTTLPRAVGTTRSKAK